PRRGRGLAVMAPPVSGTSAPFAGRPPVYDRMQRHEIEVLRDAGFSLRRIARKLGIARNTVRRILRQGPVPPSTVKALGRPKLATGFEGAIESILRETPDLLTVEILRRLRGAGYSGGKDPVYRLVRQLRRTVTSPIVRFEGVAGEFCQNDFGHVRVRYDDGSLELLHFFASRLKWSRWVHV